MLHCARLTTLFYGRRTRSLSLCSSFASPSAARAHVPPPARRRGRTRAHTRARCLSGTCLIPDSPGFALSKPLPISRARSFRSLSFSAGRYSDGANLAAVNRRIWKARVSIIAKSETVAAGDRQHAVGSEVYSNFVGFPIFIYPRGHYLAASKRAH